MSHDPTNDELEISVRPPRAVVGRLIVLTALCHRAYLELAPASQREAMDSEGERFDLITWLNETGALAVATPNEREFLLAPLGLPNRATADRQSWCIEAAAVLAWANQLLATAPSYDAPVTAAPVLAQLPSVGESTEVLLSRFELRAEEAIAAERERAELWQWRSELARGQTSTPLNRGGPPQVAMDVAAEGIAAGLLQTQNKGDFAVFGLAYFELSLVEVETLGDIAAERLRALNWLCGFGADWDTTPLEI